MAHHNSLTAYKNVISLFLAANSLMYMLVFTLSWGEMPGKLRILYVAAEIFFMVLGLLSLGLAVWASGKDLREKPSTMPPHLGEWVGTVSAVMVFIPALFAFISDRSSLLVIHGCFAAAFGLSIALLARALFQPNLATPPLSRPVYSIYGLLAILFWATVLLRVLAPDTFFLTWMIAPLNFFMVPGLSLAPALLPASSRWLEWVAYAPPLSVGAQIICLIWLDFLGVPVYTATFFVVAAAVALAGFTLFFVRFLRRGSSSLSPNPS